MDIKWKSGASFKAPADKAHAEIEKIRLKHGSVAAEQVVTVAQSNRSILHGDFEWDDKVAGHEHRLETARKLLRSLVIVRDELRTERPQRVYEVVRDTAAKTTPRIKSVYKTLEDVMSDENLRAELLGRALRELISIRNRYRDLQELAVVLRAIDKVVNTVEV